MTLKLPSRFRIRYWAIVVFVHHLGFQVLPPVAHTLLEADPPTKLQEPHGLSIQDHLDRVDDHLHEDAGGLHPDMNQLPPVALHPAGHGESEADRLLAL